MHQESASAIPSSSLWAIMDSWFSPTVLFVVLNLIIGTIAYTSSLTNQKHSRNHQPKLTNSLSLLQRIKSINFQSSHQQSQEPQNHKPNQDLDTLSDSEQTVQKPAFTHESHYFFQENLQSQVHHIFSENHESNHPETPVPFISNEKDSIFDDFRRSHEQQLLEGSGQNVGEVYREVTGNDLIKTESDISFSQSLEENHPETPLRFVFDGKDIIFDDYQHSQEEEARKDHEQIVDEVCTQVKDSNFIRTKSDIVSLQSGLGHLAAEDIDNVEARRPKTVRERSGSKVTDGDSEVDSKADDFINRFKHQLKLQRLDSIVRYRGSSGK